MIIFGAEVLVKTGPRLAWRAMEKEAVCGWQWDEDCLNQELTNPPSLQEWHHHIIFQVPYLEIPLDLFICIDGYTSQLMDAF